MCAMRFIVATYWMTLFYVALAATKGKHHSHSGVLPPFSGQHLSYNITVAEAKRLEEGFPVIIKDTKQTSGKGRGTVIQDINASPQTVMDKVADLRNYHKVVPNVRSIDIYNEETLSKGVHKIKAKFNVAVGFLSFGYFLSLTRDDNMGTFYWTLDYEHSSDFDDNTGQWQILPHPTKDNWSRVLYATDVQLYSWVPGFVVTFLTNTALIDSTTWVKREAEKDKSHIADHTRSCLRKCFSTNESGSAYDGQCGNLLLIKSLDSNQIHPTNNDNTISEVVSLTDSDNEL